MQSISFVGGKVADTGSKHYGNSRGKSTEAPMVQASRSFMGGGVTLGQADWEENSQMRYKIQKGLGVHLKVPGSQPDHKEPGPATESSERGPGRANQPDAQVRDGL